MDNATSRHGPLGLPHPETDAQFYKDVPLRRLIAWVLDALIVGVLALLVVIGTLGFAAMMLPLVLIVLSFAYRVYTLRTASATLGMRLVGIEIRDRHGLKLDSQTAIAHSGLYMVATVLFPLQLISCYLMYATRYKQGLHDMPLGTTAINSVANY